MGTCRGSNVLGMAALDPIQTFRANFHNCLVASCINHHNQSGIDKPPTIGAHY